MISSLINSGAKVRLFSIPAIVLCLKSDEWLKLADEWLNSDVENKGSQPISWLPLSIMRSCDPLLPVRLCDFRCCENLCIHPLEDVCVALRSNCSTAVVGWYYVALALLLWVCYHIVEEVAPRDWLRCKPHRQSSLQPEVPSSASVRRLYGQTSLQLQQELI